MPVVDEPGRGVRVVGVVVVGVVGAVVVGAVVVGAVVVGAVVVGAAVDGDTDVGAADVGAPADVSVPVGPEGVGELGLFVGWLDLAGLEFPGIRSPIVVPPLPWPVIEPADWPSISSTPVRTPRPAMTVTTAVTRTVCHLRRPFDQSSREGLERPGASARLLADPWKAVASTSSGIIAVEAAGATPCGERTRVVTGSPCTYVVERGAIGNVSSSTWEPRWIASRLRSSGGV